MSENKKTPYIVTSITKVKECDDGCEIEHDNGWCLFLLKTDLNGLIPAIGDTVEIYGELGRPIRGVCVKGKTIYFKGDVEVDNDYKKWCKNLEKEKLGC